MFVGYIYTMNLIQEKRETIIRENNTAQETFETLLESIPMDTRELNVTTPLHGDLDLAILKTKGYNRIHTIRIGTAEMADGTGEITSVKNIPTVLRSFSCINQLLVSLDLWLPNVTELHLENNHITSIDLRTLAAVKKIYLQNNELTGIQNLPKLLEELYIQNNKIKHIDFKDTPKLKVLHCQNNPNISLANLPQTTLDLQMDEVANNDVSYTDEQETVSPNGSTQSRDIQGIHDYKECLRIYFKMKSQYEKKTKQTKSDAYARGKTNKQRKLLASQVRPECVKCGRNVGTVFSSKNNRYVAICGNTTQPCELKIELFRGDQDSLEYLIQLYSDETETDKLEIIQQKLKTLFNYISESESAKLFKDNLDMYNKDSAMYKLLLERYHNLHTSEHTAELVKHKIIQIYNLKHKMNTMKDEYMKTQNHHIIQLIANMYVKEYMPEIHNLRTLNYKVMEIGEIERDGGVYQLFQMDTKLSDLEYVFGERPSVKHFQI
jgi:hypothetical protein